MASLLVVTRPAPTACLPTPAQLVQNPAFTFLSTVQRLSVRQQTERFPVRRLSGCVLLSPCRLAISSDTTAQPQTDH
jgi:hypothetical protein